MALQILLKKTDFDDKLKDLNKEVTLNNNKKKHVTNKVAQISEKVYYFLLGRMYFTGNDGYQNFLVFAPLLSFLILDSNK